MSIADELRVANVVTIEGRSGRGHTSNVDRIVVEDSGTTGADPSGDINSLGLIDRAVAYVERTGRVWVLADGPLGSSSEAVVVVGSTGDRTDEQTESLAVLDAVLGAAYGLSGPSTTETAPERLEGDSEAAAVEPVAAKPKRKPRKKATAEPGDAEPKETTE